MAWTVETVNATVDKEGSPGRMRARFVRIRG